MSYRKTMLIHRSINGLVNGHFLSLRRGKCIVLARMHLTTADHRRNEVSEIFAFEWLKKEGILMNCKKNASSSFRISGQVDQGFEPGKDADPAENQRDPE